MQRCQVTSLKVRQLLNYFNATFVCKSKTFKSNFSYSWHTCRINSNYILNRRIQINLKWQFSVEKLKFELCCLFTSWSYWQLNCHCFFLASNKLSTLNRLQFRLQTIFVQSVNSKQVYTISTIFYFRTKALESKWNREIST